jgi:serine/threonine-protein kinase
MPAVIRIGSTFAGCRIEGVLGRGGMGVVYLAEQPELGRKVAIKVIAPALSSDPAYLERFRRESRLAAAIEHPNAIPIYEAGIAEGETPFLVMRYVDGLDLASLVRREGRLDPDRAARITGQVAGALDEAHARGLVHRDVKPGNVLVEARRDTEDAYLTDFGLTKEVDATSGVTATGRWVGTIDYSSPEQIQGRQVDARSDVYSLGCVLFTALTGGPPFARQEDVAKLYAHLSVPPPTPSEIVSDLPRDLDRVIARALAKDPVDRFPSAGDLGRAAAAALTGGMVTEPERTVATGEAAPDATQPHPPPTPPPQTPATPGPVPGEPQPAAPPPTPAEAGAGATRALPGPVRTGTRTRRRLLPALLVLATAGLALALGVAVLGGGSDGGGGDSGRGGPGGSSGSDGSSLVDFEPFTAAQAFTVEVPVGLPSPVELEKVLKTAIRTEFQSETMNVQIVEDADDPPAQRIALALGETSQKPGYDSISDGEERTLAGGREAVRFAYRIDEEGLGPAIVFNYAFNDGGRGWRTRAAVKRSVSKSRKLALDISRHMAETLQAK